VSPKRGDSVPAPTVGTEWRIRFDSNEAAKGWQELENQASGNLRRAWDIMRNDPGPGPDKPNERHHQMSGKLATGTYRGRTLPQWQIEITGSGRIWYLLDDEQHTIWVVRAGTGHPKETE
jgi:hypothetical protein